MRGESSHTCVRSGSLGKKEIPRLFRAFPTDLPQMITSPKPKCPWRCRRLQKGIPCADWNRAASHLDPSSNNQGQDLVRTQQRENTVRKRFFSISRCRENIFLFEIQWESFVRLCWKQIYRRARQRRNVLPNSKDTSGQVSREVGSTARNQRPTSFWTVL